jgi:hypothetical protein
MLNLRQMMIEYICFAFEEQELMTKFHVNESELPDLCDIDLLEIYDQTLLTPIQN